MKFIFVILIVVLSASFSHSAEEEKVLWREGKKLSWNMFKGNPETLGNYVASTNSGVSLSFSMKSRNGEVTIDYTVQSFFYPNASWYVKEKVNPLILSHEQTHFDISELFARKLKEKFATIPRDEDFKEKAQKIYKQNESERLAMQDLFDEETSHSRIEENEIKWEAYIKQQLGLCNDWK
jgi:hypothetical protein